MKIATVFIVCQVLAFASIWQPPEPVFGLPINGLCLSADNLRMYGDKWHDGYYQADICYYDWDGTQWVWGGWLPGTIGIGYHVYELEPFITYDGQHIYYQRSTTGGSNNVIYVADWDGSGFTNERPLPSWINSTGDDRYPSVTQDGQKLYFGWRNTGESALYGIKESIWNGTDWGAPVMLPPEINQGGGGRTHPCISPDGNELYFDVGSSYLYDKIAVSRKVGGVWQQWQYVDYTLGYDYSPCLTYDNYYNQYLYFKRGSQGEPYTRRMHRSPISVEPASLGQIKANYAK